MSFVDNLTLLPTTHHIAGLQLHDAHGRLVATLENKPGQAGSVAVYAALAQRHGHIDQAAAEEGLVLYAEHTAEARANPGKHPNIDRLLAMVEGGRRLTVTVLPRA